MSDYKKLQRDTVNRVIAGVCSGLADYFNIDATVVRILFIIAFLFLSFGFWLYLLLWIFIPQKPFGNTSNNNQYGDTIDITPNNDGKSSNSAIVSSAILILLGTILLINNFYPINFSWLRRLWPVLLIIAGILIIILNSNRKDDER